MGVMLIKMSSGLLESQLYGDRQINYEMVTGNNTPYYFGQTVSPFKVKLEIAPVDGQWTRELLDNITRWINNGKFNEFYSADDIDRIYYLTYDGSPTLRVTGSNQGYIELDFMNVDCYVRSNIYNTIFDLSSNTSGTTTIQLSNLGSTTIQPNIRIQKLGAGNISIKNLSNGGQITGFTGLSANEIIYIDAASRNITTDKPNTLRYDNFTKNYLTLPYGINYLEVTGACKLNFYYRYLYSSV